MTTEKTPKIYGAMSKIMGEIGAIAKGRTQKQGYKAIAPYNGE